MLHVPGLVIIAGTGRGAGKTTVACRIIGENCRHNITAVKISSHFHEPQDHLRLICREPEFIIWEELSRVESKDSSLFLAAGATRSFYIQAKKDASVAGFARLIELLHYSTPLVCESPSLGKGVIPGVLVIISGGNINESISPATEKDLSFLEGRKALRITRADVERQLPLPIVLNESGFSITPGHTTSG